MARALGVGGVFFKSENPKKLASWYQQWLKFEFEMPNAALFRPDTMPKNGLTVWSAFGADTKYMEPSSQEYMINLVVDDLDGALAQVKEGGAEIVDDIQEEEYGRFAWFLDPEGNKVELWQPPEG
jgi:predicted enzyme related to lactoylglutathione lyase